MRIVLLFHEIENERDGEHAQPGEPAMNEDDGLRGFENVEKGVKEIGRDQFAEHQGPGIGYMTGFESRGHAAVGDLQNEDDEGCHRQFGWQGPFCLFLFWRKTKLVPEGGP